MTLVAGVDSSTQSTKVVIVDAQTGAVIRSGRAAHPDGTEVDPAAWWRALLDAVAEAGGLDDVAAISVAAQQHGLVALDADGNVVRPALLWNDTRSAEAATTLREEVGARAFAARVGVVPVASMTLAKLRWLADAEPDNAARVAAVALPHDWLTWRLRGFGPRDDSPHGPVLEALSTDASDASGTAYFSADRGTYDLDLLELGFRRADLELPRVLDAGASPGTTAASATGNGSGAHIPAGLTVGVGAGDNAGAALGLGARTGDVIVSIGTSGTVFAVTDTPARDASGTVAGFADASGRFLPLIATLNAARVIDTVAGLLGTDYAGLDDLALTAAPGADGVVLLPYFAGERTPNLPNAQASLHGLTLASSTRENLARAAVEGLLCGLADGLDAVRATGVDPERVLLIGGGAASRAVRRVAAQVLGLPVAVPEPGEYVAVGAAAQAAWALDGARPEWAVELAESLDPDPQPVVREQYRRHAPEPPRVDPVGPEG